MSKTKNTTVATPKPAAEERAIWLITYMGGFNNPPRFQRCVLLSEGQKTYILDPTKNATLQKQIKKDEEVHIRHPVTHASMDIPAIYLDGREGAAAFLAFSDVWIAKQEHAVNKLVTSRRNCAKRSNSGTAKMPRNRDACKVPNGVGLPFATLRWFCPLDVPDQHPSHVYQYRLPNTFHVRSDA